MIFGYAKMIMVGVLVAGIAGAGVYVMKLQKDNAILKANQILDYLCMIYKVAQ